MKKNNQLLNITIALLASLSINAQSNLIIENGNFNITDVNVHVRVSGNVTNQNAAVINNEGSIHLTEDFTQTGTSNYTGGGLVEFNGTADQNLSSASSLTIDDLSVDNGQKLILGSTVEVSTLADLNTNGNIELGTNDLIIQSGANIQNYDATHYVITNSTGVLQREVGNNAVEFPVGNSTYNPATLQSTGTGITDNFRIRVEDQVLEEYPAGSAGTTDAANRAWFIEETTTGGSNITMTLQWNAAEELTDFDRTDSGIHQWDGSEWDAPTLTNATANGGAWTQTLENINDFTSSPFIVADAEWSPAFVTFEIKAFLQGTYNGTDMNQYLGSLIPTSDPYGLGESVVNIPANVVDWVLVEIRDPSNNTNVLATRACFIRNDGQVVDLDGTLGVKVLGLTVTSGYIVIKHRNHLGVMTQNAIPFN